MILCNVCAGEVNERMVCRQCGTPAGVAYASAAGVPQAAYVPAPAVPVAPHVERGKGAGGKLAVVLLILAAVAGLGWWGYAARERSRAEQRRQELIRTNGPLAVESILLSNVNAKGNVLGGPAVSFARKEIRYILFEAVLRNNAVGLYDFEGNLDVKYIDPKGKVDHADSQGFSLHKPLAIPSKYGTVTRSGSLGSDKAGEFDTGKWRIEFWFEGRKIGETNFTVY